MPENSVLTHAQLKTPKAAAIAGIAFSQRVYRRLREDRVDLPKAKGK
jgi:hypothetical protein